VKRSIWIFLAAILLPSIGLGWLALRSAGEQQIILERRTAELYQKETETIAAAARALIDDERRAFNEATRQLIATEGASQLAGEFSTKLAGAWQRKAVGFALSSDGSLASPTATESRGNDPVQKFLLNNSAFLAGTVPSTVYSVPADALIRPEQARRAKSEADVPARAAAAPALAQPAMARKQAVQEAKERAAPAAAAPVPEAVPQADEAPAQEAQTRNVMPQRLPEQNAPVVSQLTPAMADFRALTSDQPEGVVTRYVQDKLEILFWLRAPQAPEMIFGCVIAADALADVWPAALASVQTPDVVLALLDEKTRPVATQPPDDSSRDWKRPFVASEIGEALPHWEAALYLQRPEQLQENARSVRRNLMLLIGAALVAIAFGGWAVFADARRQLALAQKKTDFVSNVSHELKTPLTSIRMFAELMQNGNVAAEKRGQYLRIIMAEAERLTRLINNVLDFARMERRQMRYDFRQLDLHALLARTWEGQELHLRENGFAARWQAAPPPYDVNGDEDALAQVIVNLLSNAEKYSGGPVAEDTVPGRREIELHSYLDNGSVFVSVLDRGSGVPVGEEAKIFEAFYRAHDSLSSGIQGSGLGLTLAQRIAKEHGGEITYQPRAGGGSNFTLRLPRTANHQA
jgi:signal transduction histidine kinase